MTSLQNWLKYSWLYCLIFHWSWLSYVWCSLTITIYCQLCWLLKAQFWVLSSLWSTMTLYSNTSITMWPFRLISNLLPHQSWPNTTRLQLQPPLTCSTLKTHRRMKSLLNSLRKRRLKRPVNLLWSLSCPNRMSIAQRWACLWNRCYLIRRLKLLTGWAEALSAIKTLTPLSALL